METIGILGTGRMGTRLARLFAACGHRVLLGSRDLARARAIAAVVPNHSAVVGHWGSKDAVGALLFTRDLVVLDAWSDDGRDAPGLIRELLATRRKVFLLEEGFTAQDLEQLTGGFNPTRVQQGAVPILELR